MRKVYPLLAPLSFSSRSWERAKPLAAGGLYRTCIVGHCRVTAAYVLVARRESASGRVTRRYVCAAHAAELSPALRPLGDPRRRGRTTCIHLTPTDEWCPLC